MEEPSSYISASVIGAAGNVGKNASLKLDPNCLSCSGGANQLISNFKMACLAYHPSTVSYRSQEYKREQLYQIQEQLTSRCIDIASQLSAFQNLKNLTHGWLDEMTTADNTHLDP